MSRASTLAKAIGADGAIAVSGNTTLGDASTDTVTFNAATASIPNGINFTNGNFGLGASSPAAKLQISSSSGGDTSGLRLTRTDSGGGDWKIWSTASSNGEGAGKLIFGTSSNWLAINGSGQLGLGTTTPSYLLDVWGFSASAGNQDVLRLYNQAGSTASVSMVFQTGANNATAAIRNVTTSSNAAALTFETNNGSGLTERMRISSAGVVSIANYTVLTNNRGTENSFNQNTNMAADTWYKIGALPESAGLYACSVHLDGGSNTGGGTIYWESAWSFVIGAIGGNIYNAAPEQPIVVNGMYHHRNVGEPSFKMDSGAEYDASYGAQSIWIKFPQTTQCAGLSFFYKKLL